MERKGNKFPLSFIIKEDNEYYWDEWNFYYNFNDSVEVFNLIEKQDNMLSLVKKSSIICSLCKSGLPFATYLALKHQKPLIMFSIGEFVDRNFYILGFGDEEKELLRDSKVEQVLLVDSHTRSGKSIELASKYLTDFKKNIECLVVLDCREMEKREGKNELEINSTYKLEEEIKNRFEEFLDDKSYRLKEDDFGMHDEKYWLADIGNSDVTGNINSQDKIDFEPTFNINDFFVLKGNDFLPLSLYHNHDKFKQLLDLLDNKLSIQEKKILIVPLTLGIVPFAIGLGNRFVENSKEVKLFYPLYRSISFYLNRLKEFDFERVILMDDIILSGGVIYNFFQTFLRSYSNLKIDVFSFNLYKIEDKKKTEGKMNFYFNFIYETTKKTGGKFIVGKYQP